MSAPHVRQAATARRYVGQWLLAVSHAALAREVGCACTFTGIDDCYPTPALHACRPEQIAAFAERRMRRSKARRLPPAHRSGPPPMRTTTDPSPATPTPKRQMPKPRNPIDLTRPSRTSVEDETRIVTPPARSRGSEHTPVEAEAGIPRRRHQRLQERRSAYGPVGAEAGIVTIPVQPLNQQHVEPDESQSGAHAEADAFAAAFDALRAGRRQLQEARQVVEEAERALDALFDTAGERSVRLASGWLSRHPGARRRFTLAV